MAGSNLSSALPLLLDVVADRNVQRQFDEGTLLMDVIESGDQSAPQFANMMGKAEGNFVFFPLHTAGNPNVAVGVAEGYEYPVEGRQTYNRAKYRNLYQVSAFGVSSEAQSRARGGEQSVLDMAAFEASAIIANTRRRQNFWLGRNGSGRIAGGLGVSTFANSSGTGTVTLNTTAGDTTANLEVGMEIIFRQIATGNDNGVPSAAATSKYTNWPTNSFTTGDPAVVAAITNSAVFTITTHTGAEWTGNFANGTVNSTSNTGAFYVFDSQGRVPWGIDNFCTGVNPSYMGYNASATVTATDVGGIYNVPGAIDRTNSSNAFWKAITNSDVTTDLSGLPVSIEDHIQPLLAKILQRDSMLYGEGDAIIAASNMNVWWQVVNALDQSKRTDVRTKIIEGKYDAVRYDIITFTYDQTLDSGSMWFFAPRYLFRSILTPWQVEIQGGSSYNQILGGANRPTSKWRQNLFSESQLCASSCRPNCKFTNISS